MRRLSALLLLAACVPAAAAEPVPVALTIANAAGAPLRCQVIYAHWVTGDLPALPTGGTAGLAAFRDPATREVFVPREPDGRRLMIEEILCGLDADWTPTLTHVDLEAVKRSDAAAFDLVCHRAGRVACGAWQAE